MCRLMTSVAVTTLRVTRAVPSAQAHDPSVDRFFLALVVAFFYFETTIQFRIVAVT